MSDTQQGPLSVDPKELGSKGNASESASNTAGDSESYIIIPEEKETQKNAVLTEPVSNAIGADETKIIHAEDMETETNVVPSESVLNSAGDHGIVKAKDLKSQETVAESEPASNTAADPETNIKKAEDLQTQQNDVVCYSKVADVVASGPHANAVGVSELNIIGAADLETQGNVVPTKTVSYADKDPEMNKIKTEDMQTRKNENVFATEPPSHIADVVAPANAAGDCETNVTKVEDLDRKASNVPSDPLLNAVGHSETKVIQAKDLQDQKSVIATKLPLNVLADPIINKATELETREKVALSKPASNAFGNPEVIKAEDVKTQEDVNSELEVIKAESGLINETNAIHSKTANNSNKVVLTESEHDVIDTDLDTDDEIMPPAPKKMKVTMSVQYGSIANTPNNLDYASLPKVMKFLFRLFELDPTLSLQENRNIIRAKRKHIYDEVMLKHAKYDRCKSIYIPKLPEDFNHLHVKGLIQIFSNFDVDGDNYMIDNFKSKRLNQCIIRFMKRHDCVQVFADLQEIFIYGRPIQAKLDYLDKKFNTRKSNGAVRIGYHLMLTRCNAEYQRLKQLRGLNKMNTKVDGKSQFPVQTKQLEHSIETSAVDVAKQTKMVEEDPMTIVTGMDETSSQINEESGRKYTHVESDNEDVVVLIKNLIAGNEELLHRLIKQQIGKHTNYLYRFMLEGTDKKFTGKVKLKFIKPEDAKIVQEKLNGVVVGGRALEVTLHKGHLFISHYYSRLKEEHQRSGSDINLGVAYLPPLRNISDRDHYNLKPGFVKKMGLVQPFHPLICVNNLHLQVNEAKLLEVFSLAGKVKRIDFLFLDEPKYAKNNIKMDSLIERQGRQALIEFDYALEAVQAISLFDGRELYGKAMEVLMYKDEGEQLLPLGLSSIGEGLGKNGLPLQGVRTKVDMTQICRLLFETGLLKREKDMETAFLFTYTPAERDIAKPSNINTSNTAKPSNIGSSNTAKPSNTNTSNTAKPSNTNTSSTDKPSNINSSNAVDPANINSLNADRTENPQSTNKDSPPNEIEALTALLSSGLIPPGTDCTNIVNLISALQKKASTSYSTESNLNANKKDISQQGKNNPPLDSKGANSNNADPKWSNPNPAQSLNNDRYVNHHKTRARRTMSVATARRLNYDGPRRPYQNMEGPSGRLPYKGGFSRFDNQNNPNIQPNLNLNQSDAINQLLLNMSSNAVTPNMMQPDMTQAMQAYMAQYMMQQNLANNPMMGQNSFGVMPNLNQALGMVEQAAYGNQSRWDVTSMPPNPVAHAAMSATPAVISAPSIITAPPVAVAPPMAMNMPQRKPQPAAKESSSKDKAPKRNTLMFRYLPPSVTAETLGRKMRDLGDLVMCELTGKDRAVVRFSNPADAIKCQGLFHKSKLDGKIIEVRLV